VLAPRATPVRVYLDGEQIATHVQGRLGPRPLASTRRP